jgi:hypothetical protein
MRDWSSSRNKHASATALNHHHRRSPTTLPRRGQPTLEKNFRTIGKHVVSAADPDRAQLVANVDLESWRGRRRHCHVVERRAREFYASKIIKRTVTASRHTFIAAARKARCGFSSCAWLPNPQARPQARLAVTVPCLPIIQPLLNPSCFRIGHIARVRMQH